MVLAFWGDGYGIYKYLSVIDAGDFLRKLLFQRLCTFESLPCAFFAKDQMAMLVEMSMVPEGPCARPSLCINVETVKYESYPVHHGDIVGRGCVVAVIDGFCNDFQHFAVTGDFNFSCYPICHSSQRSFCIMKSIAHFLTTLQKGAGLFFVGAVEPLSADDRFRGSYRFLLCLFSMLMDLD